MFVLGVGAQKAGTGWLHRYLMMSGFRRGALKEWHVWNVLEGPAGSHPARPLPAPARLAMLAEPEAYFDHFADGGVDITPAYAALSADTFKRIREGFERRGVDVRPVFIMREPAERTWSAWSMLRDNRATELSFLDYAASDHAAARGSYERTVSALDEAFETPWFGFYENLFSDGLASLSEYLGVRCRPELAQMRVGQRANADPIPTDARRALESQYRATYAFCRERFPETAELWG